jgi:hypothetical protein
MYLKELVGYIDIDPLRAGLDSEMERSDRYRWYGHSVTMPQTNNE